jgi:hypothetical protein
MTTARRIQAIKLIHTIKQQRIDEIGRRLAAVRMKHAAANQEASQLREDAIQEANSITPETLPFLAGYLNAIDTRRAVLEVELHDLDTKALSLEAELTEAFIDAKTSETVLDSLRKERSLADQRKDLAESAEVAQNIYLQQKAIH